MTSAKLCGSFFLVLDFRESINAYACSSFRAITQPGYWLNTAVDPTMWFPTAAHFHNEATTQPLTVTLTRFMSCFGVKHWVPTGFWADYACRRLKHHSLPFPLPHLYWRPAELGMINRSMCLSTWQEELTERMKGEGSGAVILQQTWLINALSINQFILLSNKSWMSVSNSVAHV